MKGALDSEEDPLDARLETVMPGVHQWHAANNSAVRQLTTEVGSIKSTLDSRFDRLEDTVKIELEQQDDSLAESFYKIASGLMQRKRKGTSTPSTITTAISTVPPPASTTTSPTNSDEADEELPGVIRNVRRRSAERDDGTFFAPILFVCCRHWLLFFNCF